MKTILLFILVSYGITNIAVFGSIFTKWRDFWNKISPNFLGRLFSCPMCLSMWVGMVLSYLFLYNGWLTPFFEYGITNSFVTIFLDGCLVSGGVWLINTIQQYFEYSTTYDE